MWQKDMKWTNAVWKNGASRLGWWRVSVNTEFVKNKYLWGKINQSTIKCGVPVY